MTPVDRSMERGRPQAAGSHPSPATDAPADSHNPASCPECLRLDQQLMAAAAIDDRSRCADVRVLRERHIVSVQPYPALWSEPFS